MTFWASKTLSSTLLPFLHSRSLSLVLPLSRSNSLSLFSCSLSSFTLKITCNCNRSNSSYCPLLPRLPCLSLVKDSMEGGHIYQGNSDSELPDNALASLSLLSLHPSRLTLMIFYLERLGHARKHFTYGWPEQESNPRFALEPHRALCRLCSFSLVYSSVNLSISFPHRFDPSLPLTPFVSQCLPLSLAFTSVSCRSVTVRNGSA